MDSEFVILPSGNDNYIYLLIDSESKVAVVIDPGEAEPVIEYLEYNALKLGGILITHHHADHIDGVPGLKAVYNCPVYAPLKNKKEIYFADHFVEEGAEIKLASFQFRCWEIPGHTLGHISYFEHERNWFFCGDTLFGLGCGRLFEGTPEVMFESLQRLKTLPNNTLIFCSHEYTEQNLAFCLDLMQTSQMEPVFNLNKNLDYKMISAWVKNRRAKGLPTMPTTIEREKSYNPFLLTTSAEDFAQLRKLRNEFKWVGAQN